MKRKAKSNTPLTFITCFIIVLFLSVGVSFSEYIIPQFPGITVDWYNVQMSNSGHVVWGGFDGNDTEIFLYDGTKTIQITENSYDDEIYFWTRQINSNGYIVWAAFDGNDTEIFLYDGTKTIQITENSYEDYRPRINDNGYIVWQGGVDRNTWDMDDDEIFLYDGISITKITNNSFQDGKPVIDNNGYVAWQGLVEAYGYDVFLYNGTSITQITNRYSDDVTQVSYEEPEINNGNVVWRKRFVEDAYFYYDVRLFNGNTIIPLTDRDREGSAGYQVNKNGHVVWSGVYLYNGITTTKLGDGAYARINDSGKVVWFGYDGSDWEIFYYDGKSVTQITNNLENDYQAHISNNGYVVWSRYTDNNSQDVDLIYLNIASGANSDVEDFVTRFYQLCLDRNPDQAGLDGWVNALLDGTLAGSDVAYGFIFSDEFKAKNTINEEYLMILYEAFFDRLPDPSGWDGWLGLLESQGMDARTTVLDGFLTSQEFANLCSDYGIIPTSNTNNDSDVESFVTRFYQQCLNREPDQGGLNGWVNALIDGSLSGADVAYNFIFSQEFINLVIWKSQVTKKVIAV